MAELGLQWQGSAGKSLWARKMESTSASECKACDSAALVKMHTMPRQCGEENAEACFEDDDPVAIFDMMTFMFAQAL